MANGAILEALGPLAVAINSVKLDPRNARRHPLPNLDAIKRWQNFTGKQAELSNG